MPLPPTPQITEPDVVDSEEDQDQEQDNETQGLMKKNNKDKEESDTEYSLSNIKSKSVNGENEKNENVDCQDLESGMISSVIDVDTIDGTLGVEVTYDTQSYAI